MEKTWYAVPLAVALALLGGCGGGDGTRPAGSPTSATTTIPSASAPVENPTDQAKPTSGSTPTLGTGPRAVPIEILGTVSVRQGDCLLFTPGDRAESWVLLGEAATDLQPGKGYTLKGAMDDSGAPGCPQGPAFLVSQATPAR